MATKLKLLIIAILIAFGVLTSIRTTQTRPHKAEFGEMHRTFLSFKCPKYNKLGLLIDFGQVTESGLGF